VVLEYQGALIKRDLYVLNHREHKIGNQGPDKSHCDEAKLLTGTILRMIYLGMHNLPFLNFSIWALQNGWRFYYKYSLGDD
jgi:hypothetical protein